MEVDNDAGEIVEEEIVEVGDIIGRLDNVIEEILGVDDLVQNVDGLGSIVEKHKIEEEGLGIHDLIVRTVGLGDITENIHVDHDVEEVILGVGDVPAGHMADEELLVNVLVIERRHGALELDGPIPD